MALPAGRRGVRPDQINPDGSIKNSGSQYELPIASAETLGGVKVGSGLSINSETGALSASQYSLPPASAETLGGVKVGSGLSITDGVLSATGGSGGGSIEMDYANVVDTNSMGGYSTHADNETYTAPSDGIVYVSTEANNQTADVKAKVNGVFVAYGRLNGAYSKVCLPVIVKQGDVVTEDCTLVGTSNTYSSRFIFVPFA